MLWVSRENRIAVAGNGLAGAGVVVFTQLDVIENWRFGSEVLGIAVLGSLAAILVGFVIACVGSVTWSKRTRTYKPLKIAVLIAVATFLLTRVININVHGPSGILMFVVLLSVINVFALALASGL
jgi:hypothetical protein